MSCYFGSAQAQKAQALGSYDHHGSGQYRMPMSHMSCLKCPKMWLNFKHIIGSQSSSQFLNIFFSLFCRLRSGKTSQCQESLLFLRYSSDRCWYGVQLCACCTSHGWQRSNKNIKKIQNVSLSEMHSQNGKSKWRQWTNPHSMRASFSD